MRPLVIAHRGASGTRPENTLAAFRHAVALGADMIELDVQLTRDGEVVVIHDTSLDRTTDGQGPVAARELGKIFRGPVIAAGGFTPETAEEVVPTTREQPVDRLLAEETQAAVRAALDALPPRDRLVLSMFFIDGRSYQEIASLARLPMGTVATVISRSRLKLRELLQSKGVFDEESE